ncbi:phosphatidylserine decarboxylase family protein [Pseudoalteromonas sp. T1lg10]|uniref:phosphatidylserine decarboxylase family protein n=1 Tax=Pseudoalteromonas sp. T1lg10 TaxID=2077093 RepID=UPI000CF6847F|nr:phosphatidylserine decarboxylase family protein [Pseudoalteromonas sp. T1lg10]
MNTSHTPYRVGEWLPQDQETLNDWLRQLAAKTKQADLPLQPCIQAFKDYIEGDAGAFMLFTRMFNEQPKRHNTPIHGGDSGPEPAPIVENYQQMLAMCNYVLSMPPEFNETGLVGFPINAILDRVMATESGYCAFRDPTVNKHFKRILNDWGNFLKSSESVSVLNGSPTGWLSDAAMAKMAGSREEFIKTFECDPTLPHYGFSCWDDFFTRVFKADQRPVAAPDDNNVIANACESAPYKWATNVQLQDTFWIKGQPYSLQHMLNNNADYYPEFAGGTVYQAFLSATQYHRWNSPVDGVIEMVEFVDGSYYAEAPAIGEDPAGPNESQGYITEMATRAIIYIKADSPDIGLMAFMAVGMAEVSTCDVTVKPQQVVKKGDELGMFHFGGSTHCLLFKKGVNLSFNFHGQELNEGQNYLLTSPIHVKSEIATVVPNKH